MRKKTFIGMKNGEVVTIEWELKKGVFSASGNYLNKLGTDYSQCGQCLDSIVEDFPKSEQAYMIWLIHKYHHLNDMRAGSPIQEQLIKDEIRPKYELIKKSWSQLQTDFREMKQAIMKRLEKQKYSINFPIEKYWDDIVSDITFKYLSEKNSNREPSHKKPTTYYLGAREATTKFKMGEHRKPITIYPKQKSLIIEHHKWRDGPPQWYDFVKEELELRGRYIDPDFIYDGRAYKYGTAWLRTELPDEVVEEIENWVEVPTTYKTPAERYVEEHQCEVRFIHFKNEMNWYKMRVDGKVEFDFQAGTAIKGVDAVTIVNALLDEAVEAQHGFSHCLAWCEGLGYGAQEAYSLANQLVDNFEKMERVDMSLLLEGGDE